MRTIFFVAVLFFVTGIPLASSQTGIAIGPPRVYFTIGPGQSQTEKILVSNPSKDYTLELGISLEDWEYNERGDNIIHPAGTLSTSCAAWVSVQEAFFSLGPGESREIEIQMTVPLDHAPDGTAASTPPVRTAMLYVTQLNPRDGVDETGANIRIAVRSGIKLYQRMPGPVQPSIDITNFRLEDENDEKHLSLHYVNNGSIWADGVINIELLNQQTGAKITIPEVRYYSMPGDNRIQAIPLPADLAPGSYIATAIVDYGDSRSVQIAELEFNLRDERSETN